MADEGTQSNRGTLLLAAVALAALIGAGVAAGYLLPGAAGPQGELPPAKPIARPDAAVPGLRRLSVAALETSGALPAEAVRPALVDAATRLDGCVPPGGKGVQLELAVSGAGLVAGVQGDVGDAAQNDGNTLLCVSQLLSGLRLPPPTDGQPARVKLRLEPSE